ncbi:hypothetical protein EF912_33565 [Streptomyces sp. WAC07061]|uniref:DUF6286 domain-containing Asp23/Gls24 family envelope stress response protein n=1 Tax=Streptomyces sp. WAC07061 TaxID=2487410 RepID=UPI000F777892|nr:DUF6286 domain-containing protein [Streptomyces sp. WAC07061]RSS39007.1 hypothetical protein EF912_33565 [Streptomyces sp. WAC07061]
MSAAQRGVTTVADRVTAKIARQAAAKAIIPAGGHVLRSAATTRGRCVDVTVEVDLPPSAPADTARMVHLRDHLTSRTRHLTGLAVAPAHLRIRELGPLTPSPRPDTAVRPSSITARRPWSPRPAAATGLALAVAVLSALTLWTVLHLPGSAAPPRGQVRHWLTEAGGRPLVRPAAGLAAAAAGGWLLFLALSPGHRRLLPLGCPPPARAVISRRQAARLVRAAVTEVPGLRIQAVGFAPRKVTVRAEAVYGTAHDIRSTTTAAIARTLRTMGLRQTPKVRLVLHPARDPHTTATRPARRDGDA